MKTTGILLAGGASSRMGQDKALLPWRGMTLLERQFRLLESLGLDRVVVAGKRPGYPCVDDPEPHAGPLAALYNLAQCFAGETRVVVIPVDMPLLEACHLEALLVHPSPLIAYAGHPLPFAFTFDDDFMNIMRTRLQQGRTSLKGLWDDCADGCWMDGAGGNFLLNANTPQEWDACRKDD